MAVRNPVVVCRRLMKYSIERNRIKFKDDGKDGDEETDITDAVHDKSFFRSVIVVDVFKPVSDKQVRTETYTFPSNKENHIIRSQHQEEHEKNKKIQVAEIFCIVRCIFLLHVSDGI